VFELSVVTIDFPQKVAYGSTETSPLSHVSFIGDPPECTIHTVGTALDHVEVCDDDLLPWALHVMARSRTGEKE
jgi:hypothetical protein